MSYSQNIGGCEILYLWCGFLISVSWIKVKFGWLCNSLLWNRTTFIVVSSFHAIKIIIKIVILKISYT